MASGCIRLPSVQRAQIFDRERVVWAGEQRAGRRVGGADRLLHGRSVGQPGVQRLPQSSCVRPIGARQTGRAPQQGKVGGLCAEGQVGDAAERVQQRRRPAREPFRRGQAGRERRLEHKVGPAAHGRFGAGVFFQHRQVAALHIVAAHRAHDCGIRAQNAARLGDMVRVARVKGIVFGDNAADGHGFSLLGYGGILVRYGQIMACTFRTNRVK